MKKFAVLVILALTSVPSFSQSAPKVDIGGSVGIGLKAVQTDGGAFVTTTFSTKKGVESVGASGSLRASAEWDYYGAALQVNGADDGTVVTMGDISAWYELADNLYISAGTAFKGGNFGTLSTAGGDHSWVGAGYGLSYLLLTAIGDFTVGGSISPKNEGANQYGLGFAYELPTWFAFHASTDLVGADPENFTLSLSLLAVDYLTLTGSYARADLQGLATQEAGGQLAYAFIDPFTAGVKFLDKISSQQWLLTPYVSLILSTEVGIELSCALGGTESDWVPRSQDYSVGLVLAAGTGALTFAYEYTLTGKTDPKDPQTISSISANYGLSF